MKIANICQAKSSKSNFVQIDAPLKEVVGELSNHQDGGLIAVDRQRRFEGVLTDHDVVRAFQRFGSLAAFQRVGDVMTRAPLTCRSEDKVGDVAATLAKRRSPVVVVMSKEEPVAVLSAGRVLGARLDEMANDEAALRRYVCA